MGIPAGEIPAGFVSFSVGSARVVCADYAATAARTALGSGTLFDFAAHDPSRRELSGRGVAYAVTLPGDVERVVVRHNRHGGLLAPLTGDLFRTPSNAPYELRTSERLRRAGVPTPTMVGYVVYPAFAGFCRADVMSREVPYSFDLATVLLEEDRERLTQAIAATHALLVRLAEVGARHHDLNVKNVLLHYHQSAAMGAMGAMALDVDRVVFEPVAASVHAGNVDRLMRSMRKWRDLRGAQLTDAELARIDAQLRDTRS
jgi:hypothetical protein